MKSWDLKCSENNTDETSNPQNMWDQKQGEFPNMVLWQWHGKSLGDQRDHDVFWEHIQLCRRSLFPKTVTRFPPTPARAPSPASLLPEHSGHQQHSWEFCSSLAPCYPHVTASLWVFKMLDHSQENPPLAPISLTKQALNPYPHPCVLISGFKSFSTEQAVLDLSPPWHLLHRSLYQVIFQVPYLKLSRVTHVWLLFYLRTHTFHQEGIDTKN